MVFSGSWEYGCARESRGTNSPGIPVHGRDRPGRCCRRSGTSSLRVSQFSPLVGSALAGRGCADANLTGSQKPAIERNTMGFLCDGRTVVITGAGRGIGRGHALEFARQGANVVVNDIGTELDGSGGSTGPAADVVEEIRAMGGEAVANGDDISTW